MRYIFLLIWLTAGTLSAQMPSYMHYQVEDGLPSALVYCAAQDSRGFMWFGTDKGLVRFDGTRFQVFSMQDGLPDPEVLNIFEDSSGRLWLSCFHKKPCYYKDGEFHTAENDPVLDQIEMETGTYTFAEDDDGNVWIAGTHKKFCRYDGDLMRCFDSPVERGIIVKFTNIITYKNNVYFFNPSGIYRMIEKDSFERIYETKNNLFYNFKTYIVNNQNKIAISAGGKLSILETKGYKISMIESIKEPFGIIYLDSNNGVWQSSFLNGIQFYNFNKDGLKHPTKFLKNKKVSKVFQDKSGSFWFTTLDDGIFYLDKKSSHIFNKESNNIFDSDNITAIAKSKNPQLIVGDDSGYLYFYNNKIWTKKRLGTKDEYNRVIKIIPLPENEYSAISDKYIYNSKIGTIEISPKKSLSIGAPKTINWSESKKWVGSSTYLISWKSDHNKAQVILKKRITTIEKDEENNLWVGGLEGIFSERDSFQINYGEQFPPLKNRIITIKNAGGHQLWIATPEHGVISAKTADGAITGVDILNDHLKTPIHHVNYLFTEENGTLWIATNTGVYSVDRKFQVRHFNEKTGLASNDVNAILVDQDTLWAATTSGLSKILLRHPDETGYFPTYLAGIKYLIDDDENYIDLIDSIPPDRTINLFHGTSNIELDLAALHYKSKGNVVYEYITTESNLPFYCLTWKNIKNSYFKNVNPASDTTYISTGSHKLGVSVPAGIYHTKLSAILPSGIKSLQPDEWVLAVFPAWYETIWFSLIIAGLVGLISFRFAKVRSAIKRLESLTSQLHLQAIRSQINPHFVGNSINAIQQFFYPPNASKASDYIAAFTGLLRLTIRISDQNFIPLREEIKYITTYLELFRLRFENKFYYNITGLEIIDPDILFPTMILQPILENATIHGLSPKGDSFLNIHFEYDKRTLTCTITDNGVGIKASKSAKENSKKRISQGISLIRKKIKVINEIQPIDLVLKIYDLGTLDKDQRGTKAILTFYPANINTDNNYIMNDYEHASRNNYR